MQVTSNGILISGITTVAPSTIYANSVAILDNDGVWIQVPITEINKLISLYNDLNKIVSNSSKEYFTSQFG